MNQPISCEERETLVHDPLPGLELSPVSSLTNFIGGEVSNPRLPPMTVTVWGYDNGTEVLRDELDADGCRHWLICGDPT